MCSISTPKAPPPPPPPPPPAPPAPPAPTPELKVGKDSPDMDKTTAGINRKGRSRLRIDLANSSGTSEGSGLNIPQ